MREGLVLLDSRANILTINRSAAELFSIPSDARTGQPALSLSRSAALLATATCPQARVIRQGRSGQTASRSSRVG